MTDRKLVHQALDMLKQAKDSVADWGAYASEYFQHKHNLQGSIDDIQAQITVLSERLAQPEQEPVAWVLEWTFNGEERGRRLYDDETHCVFDAENDGGVCRPLVYGDTSPPPQRQPLTDEEIMNLCAAQWASHPIEVARAIEAAHNIKGEA